MKNKGPIFTKVAMMEQDVKAQHTPGPWVADRTMVRNAEGEHRFTCGLTRTAWAGQDEMLANARLIAAVPDLLEELEGFVVELTGNLRNSEKMLTINHAALVQRIARARAAIAKATGETND